MNTTRAPLRERKKAKIREALIATSFRLFSEQGYTETTLEQICDQCDVTVQTLLRYFGSKDDLLFGSHAGILQRFTSGLSQAAVKKSALEYWLRFLRQNLAQLQSDKTIRQTYRIIIGSPSLLVRFRSITRQYESAVEQALSEEVGLKPGQDLYSTLMAHLIVSGPIEQALRCIEHGEIDLMVERCERAVQFILENFKRPAVDDDTRSAKLPPKRKTR
jgi:AcrR family transcriptional regulator